MLDKVDEMRKQRIKLVETLRDSLERDDITSNALAAAYADPTPLLAAQIARHDKHIKLIEQNLNAQAAILDALTAANANFADHRKDIFNLIARFVSFLYSDSVLNADIAFAANNPKPTSSSMPMTLSKVYAKKLERHSNST